MSLHVMLERPSGELPLSVRRTERHAARKYRDAHAGKDERVTVARSFRFASSLNSGSRCSRKIVLVGGSWYEERGAEQASAQGNSTSFARSRDITIDSRKSLSARKSFSHRCGCLSLTEIALPTRILQVYFLRKKTLACIRNDAKSKCKSFPYFLFFQTPNSSLIHPNNWTSPVSMYFISDSNDFPNSWFNYLRLFQK